MEARRCARPLIQRNNDGVKTFFTRARERARKLDRGETVSPEFVVSFEHADEMRRLMSVERARLLAVA